MVWAQLEVCIERSLLVECSRCDLGNQDIKILLEMVLFITSVLSP